MEEESKSRSEKTEEKVLKQFEDWMKDEFHYEFEGGNYFYKKGNVILERMEHVAIVFDSEGQIWLTLFHGDPDKVKKRFDCIRRQLKVSGYPDLIEHLIYCSGKFPVKELNHLVHYSGYGRTFYLRNVVGEINEY